MTTVKRFRCLGLALVILSGCIRHPVPAPLTAEDLRIARQAMSLSEVSLMLRSGHRQEAIIAEVQQRRVGAAPDAAMEESLLHSGASPALIHALKEKENLLTQNQKEAFESLAAEKTQRIQQEATSRQQAALEAQQVQNHERQKRAYALEQATRNAHAAEDKEKAYWQAWDAYKKQKEYLEGRIAILQAQINRRRSSYSYRESDLIADNQELDRLNDELLHLPAPPLR